MRSSTKALLFDQQLWRGYELFSTMFSSLIFSLLFTTCSKCSSPQHRAGTGNNRLVEALRHLVAHIKGNKLPLCCQDGHPGICTNPRVIWLLVPSQCQATCCNEPRTVHALRGLSFHKMQVAQNPSMAWCVWTLSSFVLYFVKCEGIFV